VSLCRSQPNRGELAGLPKPEARRGRRVGDWIAFASMMWSSNIDERHVGEVRAIASDVHVMCDGSNRLAIGGACRPPAEGDEATIALGSRPRGDDESTIGTTNGDEA
jgi:hypothetical protein